MRGEYFFLLRHQLFTRVVLVSFKNGILLLYIRLNLKYPDLLFFFWFWIWFQRKRMKRKSVYSINLNVICLRLEERARKRIQICETQFDFDDAAAAGCLQVLWTRRCFQELLIRISMATSKGLQGIVSERIKALYDFSLKALCLPQCTHRHKILNVFKAKRCSQPAERAAAAQKVSQRD
jgi:hypothetical protein